jgi:hypothetical protein
MSMNLSAGMLLSWRIFSGSLKLISAATEHVLPRALFECRFTGLDDVIVRGARGHSQTPHLQCAGGA